MGIQFLSSLDASPEDVTAQTEMEVLRHAKAIKVTVAAAPEKV